MARQLDVRSPAMRVAVNREIRDLARWLELEVGPGTGA
jgi:hypothetical protein